MQDALVLHCISLLLGVVIVVWGTRVPQLLALVAAAGAGLWIGLVFEEGLTFNHAVFGVYTPTGEREPLIVCIVFATLSGCLSYFARQTALSLLTAILLSLNAVSLLRAMDVSPIQATHLDALTFPTFGLVAAVVLVLAFLATALLVFRLKRKQLAIGFSTAQLGSLLMLSALSQIVQRAGSSRVPFSILGDLARVMAQPRGSRCEAVWSGEDLVADLAADDSRRLCQCGALCRTEIFLWIAGSWGLMVLRRMCRRQATGSAPRSKQHRPVPRVEPEPVSPSTLGAPMDRGARKGKSFVPEFDETWEDPHLKLQKLREWLEEGLISLGDFETKKRELLGRL